MWSLSVSRFTFAQPLRGASACRAGLRWGCHVWCTGAVRKAVVEAFRIASPGDSLVTEVIPWRAFTFFQNNNVKEGFCLQKKTLGGPRVTPF